MTCWAVSSFRPIASIILVWAMRIRPSLNFQTNGFMCRRLIMPKTAVGLFENPGLVEDVVSEIEDLGFPRKEVRTLKEPRGSALQKAKHRLTSKDCGAEVPWFLRQDRISISAIRAFRYLGWCLRGRRSKWLLPAIIDARKCSVKRLDPGTCGPGCSIKLGRGRESHHGVVLDPA